jgi:hypothetical protein
MDLDVRLREDEDVMSLLASFNPERYGAAGIEAMLASIRQIVVACADRPGLHVSECERFMTPA